MVTVYKKTGIFCHICNSELQLVEDIYRDDDGFKDVEHYFECPNGCDNEVNEGNLDNYEGHIERIISGAWERIKEKDKQVGAY